MSIITLVKLFDDMYVYIGDGNLGGHTAPIMEAQLEHPSMKSLKSTVKPSNLSIVDTNYGIVIDAIIGLV